MFWGYAEGSRIARPLLLQFRTGLKEWPELYVMLAHLIAGQAIFTYSMIRDLKLNLYATRYKHAYTVFRPYDERVQIYPKPWITDTKYLSADHPMTTSEISWFHFPPVEVHRNDPHIRGPSYDGKEPTQTPMTFNWKWIPGLKKERDEWKESMGLPTDVTN